MGRCGVFLLGALSGLCAAGAGDGFGFGKDGRWELTRGVFTNAAAAAGQVRRDADGISLALDPTCTDKGGWAVLANGNAPEISLDGSRLELEYVDARLPVVNPRIGLMVTDARGETFQFHPVMTRSDGPVMKLGYLFVDGGWRDHWGGNGDGKALPPFKFTGLNLGYTGRAGTVRFRSCVNIPNREGVVYSDRLIDFEPDADMFLAPWDKDVKCQYEGNAFVVSPVKGRFCGLRYRRYPGARPFRGTDAIVLYAESGCTGTAKLSVCDRDSGAQQSFTGNWDGKTVRFETPSLDPARYYQLGDVEFHANSGNGPWSVRMSALRGFFRAPEADICRFDVETSNPMRVLVKGTDESPVFTFSNPSDRTLKWKTRITLSDLAGHDVRFFKDIVVPAGETKRIPFDRTRLQGMGLWRCHAEITGEDGSVAWSETRFAILDPHPVTPLLDEGKFRFGINYHYGRYSPVDRRRTMDALVACGAKLARLDFGRRDDVQGKGPECWDWSYTDKGVEDFLAHGIAIDSIVWSGPRWAARPECQTNKNWRVWALSMPADEKLCEEYFRRLSERYGRKIAYYEIGNEWELNFPGTVDEAIAIQRLCYRGLKRGDPSVTVIPNGWASWDSASQQVSARMKGFPERMMVETKGCYDAHPIHNHGAFPVYRRSIIERFLPRRRQMGIDNVPWYSNETALTSAHGDEVYAAEHVWKKISFAWAYGSRDYIWYNLKATGYSPRDPEQGYGILDAEYRPRAAYAAFSAMTALLSGFEADGVLKDEKTRGVFRFRGERGNGPERVILGWDSAVVGARTLRIRTDAVRGEEIDFMGNRSEFPVKDGVATWRLRSCPSAVRLIGANKADPFDSDIDDIPEGIERVVQSGKGAASKRNADLVLDDIRAVHCFWDANPMTTHRTWQGPSDCSIRAWFGRQGGDIAILVKVSDDIHCQHATNPRAMSEGDCVRMTIDVEGQPTRWELGFRLTDDGKADYCVWEGVVKTKDAIRFSASRGDGETAYKILLSPVAFGATEKCLHDGGMKIGIKVDDRDVDDSRDLWMGLENPVRVMF